MKQICESRVFDKLRKDKAYRDFQMLFYSTTLELSKIIEIIKGWEQVKKISLIFELATLAVFYILFKFPWLPKPLTALSTRLNFTPHTPAYIEIYHTCISIFYIL